MFETWIVREAEPADAAGMLTFMDVLSTEEDLNIPLAPGEFKMTLEEEERIVQAYHEAENSIFLLAVNQGEIIGLLNLEGGKRKALAHSAELGLSVARPWRGKGVGNALMSEAMRWARANPVLKRIELFVYARNAPAIHLYEKYGFEIEARRRSAIYQHGQYLDDYLMALLLD